MADKSSSSGIGFIGMLTILFIGLKLTGNIDWSWFWVLSPFWIPAALIAALGAISLLVAAIAALFESVHKGYLKSRGDK